MADESQTDAPMTPRERRRSRASSGAGKPAGGPTLWKRYKVHVIILVIFGGLATAMAVNASQTQDCPGHWHSTMDVYVNGDRVTFNDPKYDLNGARANGGSMSLAAHMHQPDDAMWHWEPVGADCIPLGDVLDVIDMELTSSKLVLDGAHEKYGDAGTFTENETHKLSAWHRIGEGDWEEISIRKILDRQAQPDERQLIVFGNETEEQMAPFRAKADSNNLQGSSGGQGGASYVPVVGVSIMGLVALGVWHSLSRKM